MRTILAIFFSTLSFASAAQIIQTIAGNGSPGYSYDGIWSVNAKLYEPSSIVVDKIGNIYIADTYNNRIRKVDTTGIISTFAGNGSNGYGGDGGLATAAEFYPAGVAIDTIGNIYIADAENNVVRKIDTAGIITTIAGNGDGAGTFNGGYSGDGGPALNAELSGPTGVAVDIHGNVYIADLDNNAIRKVNTQGIITSVAGNSGQGFAGDGGPAVAALLYNPSGISVDVIGNLYISDLTNARIRKVDTAGIITTIAGNGTTGYSGDGGNAKAAEIYPGGNAIFMNGDLFITDKGNNRIRKVDSTGIITTVAGTGMAGYSGDGGSATAAQLNTPANITLDRFGNLFIADRINNRIREVVFDPKDAHHVNVEYINAVPVLHVYPTPTRNVLHVDEVSTAMHYQLLNVVGSVVQQGTLSPGTNSIPVQALPTGMYLLYATDVQQKLTFKISIEN